MTKKISYLDGFRGGAAFWVLAAHCAIWGGVKGVWIPDPKIAVDLFMVMSGFLMAYGAIQRKDDEPIDSPTSWLRFYVRRYFRVAPAYYLVLLVAVLLAEPFLGGYAELRALNLDHWGTSASHDKGGVEYSIINIFLHVTFLFGMLPEYASSTGLPDWSLGLEMQFYFAFPFLYIAMERYGHIRASVLLVILTGITILVFSRMEGINGSRGLFPEPSFLFLKLHLFIIGILLCDAFHRDGITKKRRYATALFALALSLIQFRFYRLEALIFVASVGIVIVMESGSRQRHTLNRAFSAILGNRLTKFMADASYSVYLIHGVFIAIFGAYFYRQTEYALLPQSLRYLILLSVVTVCSYSVAFVMDRLVEQPGIRLGKRLAKKVKIERHAFDDLPRAT